MGRLHLLLVLVVFGVKYFRLELFRYTDRWLSSMKGVSL